MYDIIFFVLVILYTLVSAKVDEWITISALGFKMETPEMFLKHPRYYDVIRSALFLSAIAVFFAMSTKYAGGGIIALAWFGAGWVGRKKAFKNYRQIIREMKFHEEDKEQRAKYESELNKTDQELMEMVQTSMKYGL
ncbi:MAG: hypothetical protein KAS23_12705 [Anaerohalosphaera sp.]|nr:hypothetical protein [Anaerohalosphaera sp.]